MIPIIIGLIILIGTGLLVNTNKVKKESNKIVINTAPPKVAPKSSTSLSQTPNNVETAINLKYPNSTQVSQNGSTNIYESTDNPDTITDWFKQTIEGMDMNVKSFVTTKTNGNILNKLVGSDGKRVIKVEITKNADDPKITITVVFRGMLTN